MDQRPIIDLRYADWNGPGLIVCINSGVKYTNQTGGFACLSPFEEGVFVPLYDELANQEEKLIGYFTKIKYSGNCMNGIDEDDAQFIDSVLINGNYTKYIKVDLNKLKESHEAWIYVLLSNVPDIPNYSYSGELKSAEKIKSLMCPVYGFSGYKGVLTWNNSD